MKKKNLMWFVAGVSVLQMMAVSVSSADLWSAIESGGSKAMFREATKLYNKTVKEAKKQAKEKYDSYSSDDGSVNNQKDGFPPSFSNRTVNHTASRAIFNSKNCSQVLRKKLRVAGGDITICYDYKLKSALYVDYTLTKEMIEGQGLKDRLKFTDDKDIPSRYRTSHRDYTRTGYDRGHLANDASFDYAVQDLSLTYQMSNIIPQDPTVNRKIWIKAEKYERYMAMKLGSVSVLNKVVFSKNPKRINNGIAVPMAFVKIIENKREGFKKCFWFDNFYQGSVGMDKLRDHQTNCNTL